jgi:hypothetical protein
VSNVALSVLKTGRTETRKRTDLEKQTSEIKNCSALTTSKCKSKDIPQKQNI